MQNLNIYIFHYPLLSQNEQSLGIQIQKKIIQFNTEKSRKIYSFDENGDSIRLQYGTGYIHHATFKRLHPNTGKD